MTIEAQKTYILCQKVIPLPGNSNTYCMRELGHSGKCGIVYEEPKEEKKVENEKI